jgi:mannose-1-phosphate guanylyltransferase
VRRPPGAWYGLFVIQRFAVIMAGGSGERFWPASRQARPKQLLRLTDERRSMLEEAIDRIAPLIAPENVIVATNEILADPIAAAIPRLPRENVIAEPAKRNTAACLALAAAHLAKRVGPDGEASMAVLTADHRITDEQRFRETVALALDFAEANDALVTIGVVPTRPETGYGYIEVAEAGARGQGRVLPVGRFLEKPDLETARRFATSGRHLWNSGMFFWRVSSFLSGLDRHMPDLARATAAMRADLASGSGCLSEIFSGLADVSIDVGLMERAGNVHVVPATFPWDDVGAWDALARTRVPDLQGNVADPGTVLVDARDCIVYNAAGEAMAVAVVGVTGLVVATTPDAVLVCDRERAQDVKRAVAALRERGRERFT